MQHIGRVINRLILEQDMSMEQLAHQCSCTQEYLQEVAGGEREIDLGLANALSQQLGFSPQFWLSIRKGYRWQ